MKASAIPVLLVLSITGGSNVAAQRSLELGPAVGIYFPLSSFAGPVTSTATYPLTGLGTWTQQNAPALGVVGSLWLNRHLGLRGTYQSVSSGVSQVIPDAVAVASAGSVHLLTLEAQARVHAAARLPHVSVSGGLARIWRRGDAFRSFGSPNTLGAVFGLGADFPLKAGLGFGCRASVLLYRFSLHDPTTKYTPSTQADFLGQALVTYHLF